MILSAHLGLFAKYWQPGQVKTRLASRIGAEAASRIYFEFLAVLFRRLGAAAETRSIIFSPRERLSEFSDMGGANWQLVPQSSGGLGDRLKNYFQEILIGNPSTGNTLDRGKAAGRFEKVIAIGSDCPLLNESVIDQAIEGLDRNPVVIGPSTDGGYYLIAMREPCLQIFEGIAWSTPQVLEQTTELLEKSGIGYKLLGEMTDIDQWADLKKLTHQLEQLSNADLATMEFAEKLGQIMTEFSCPTDP